MQDEGVTQWSNLKISPLSYFRKNSDMHSLDHFYIQILLDMSKYAVVICSLTIYCSLTLHSVILIMPTPKTE